MSDATDIIDAVVLALRDQTQLAPEMLRSIVHEEVRRVLPPDRGFRVVISASGPNHTGIVAGIAQALSELGADIHDIRQTVVDDHFTMMLVVDSPRGDNEHISFATLQSKLQAVAEDLGIHVVAFHQDLLQTMHSV